MGLDAVVYKSGTEEEYISKRLGNISLIAYLREQLVLILSKESVLLSRVLYSGTHAGDEIAAEDLHRLRDELSVVRKMNRHDTSRELSEFVASMEQLLSAAELEDSPIVFT